MKKLFSNILLIAVLVFALCTAAFAAEYSPVVFKTTEAEVLPGGSISTTLYLEEGSNLIDFELQLLYDSEMVQLKSAEQAAGLTGSIVITEKEGAVHISFTNATENLTERTDLVELTFDLHENAGPGTYDFLTLDEDYQYEAHTMVENNLFILPFETDFAQLNVYNFGDIDLNHKVSVADVTYLRQHLVYIRELSEYQLGLADTYYDTEVSIADAVRLQQYLADKTLRLGNRVNVTFMDKDGQVYRVRSAVIGSGLTSIPELPAYTGYHGGVWSTDAAELVGTDFQNLEKSMTVYAIYKKDASEAVTFYKERLSDTYYAQSSLTGNLNLVNKMTWQDGYTADIYWSSTDSAILNASTGVFTKPNFDSELTLTATIISYQNGTIEAQDYIAFDYTVDGTFLCPSKVEVEEYLQQMFEQELEQDFVLPAKVSSTDMGSMEPFELRLEWFLTENGSEKPIVKLERLADKQTLQLKAVAYFNSVPLENDGVMVFDNVVMQPVTPDEVRSYMISQIAANTTATVTDGTAMWSEPTKYGCAVNWISGNTATASFVGNNVIEIEDVINGTPLPVTVQVSYSSEGEKVEFELPYTLEVATDNSTLIPGTNIDQGLYDAIKEAIGIHGALTTEALKNVKFVYLDLSEHPEIQDLSALSYCTNLRVLNISGLKSEGVKETFNQIATLTKLEALIASDCGITDEFLKGTPLLDKMINLQMLDLSHNNLTSLDGVLSRDNRYGQLLELYLNDNQLTDISALCEVAEETVDILDSDNNVVQSYTEYVVKNRAPMLRFLILDNNHLNDEDLVAFRNFKLLKFLSLGNNDITSASYLKDMKTLLELHLQGNRIQDVRPLRYLTNLQSLFLSHNQIANKFSGSREVNVSYLKYLTNLEILYLNDNKLEDISDLETLDKLMVLNVNNNRLQDLSMLADKGETMVELYAENNQIGSFSFIRDLNGLTRLMLSGNGGVYESALNGYLAGLTKLRTLTLSGKDLRSLSFLSAMPNLVRLDVADCNLPSYVVTSGSNDDGTMTVNSCTDNIAAIHGLMSSLQYLDVSNNGLAYGAEAMEQYLAANGGGEEIESIRFSGSTPMSFEDLYEMTNLKVLYADNLADAVDASELFSVMTNLRYVSMENCGITDLDWLSKFRNLTYVDLAGNDLEMLDLGRDISLRSRGTLEYLYADSAVDGEFVNSYADFDGNVLKEFSASNLQINCMEAIPDMELLTSLNLSHSGITDLAASSDGDDTFALSRFADVETLDLTGVQADLAEVNKLQNLKTLHAIGKVDDTVFQKQNLLTLYDLHNKGVDCYLYTYEAPYLPNAKKEGGDILGTLKNHSCALTVAADGMISDNNPVLEDEVNGFDIEWTVSNEDNYAVEDGKLVVIDYTDIDDEVLTLTATIEVYPDQDPVSRTYELDMTILRAATMDYINIDAEGAEAYLTRGSAFTYDVSCIAAETDGFADEVFAVYTDIVYDYGAVAADGKTKIPYDGLVTVNEDHTFVVSEDAPLGSALTITVEVGHSVDGEFIADQTFKKVIAIADRTFTLTLHPNGGTVIDNDGNTNTVKQFSEEAILFETFRVERPGYIFNGWFTDEGCAEDSLYWKDGNEKPKMPSEDLTLYADWTAHSFTVYFDATGGGCAETSRGVLVGTPYGTLPEPTKTGHTFVGWHTEDGELITEDTVVGLDADQTLYAQWQVNTYTVSFDANGGSVDSTTKTVTYGEMFGALPVPVRSGFSFGGWYSDASNGVEVTASTKILFWTDLTLYAHWHVNSYRANWNAGVGYDVAVERTDSPYAFAGVGALSAGDTVYYGDVLKVTYIPWTGYSIASNGPTTITVTGAVDNIHAEATPNSYIYHVVYYSSNGTYLGETNVSNTYGTSHTITPVGFSGYVTPVAQTVAWDSVTPKTIRFEYAPAAVTTSAKTGSNTTNGTKYLTYSATVEYQNRTATSVQLRVTMKETLLANCYDPYEHLFRASVGSVSTGEVQVLKWGTWKQSTAVNKPRTATKTSDWITVPLTTTAKTTVTMKLYGWRENYNGDYYSDIVNSNWTVNIPAY